MAQLMQDCRIPTFLTSVFSDATVLPVRNNLLVQVPSLSMSLGSAAVLQHSYEVGKVYNFCFVLWS